MIDLLFLGLNLQMFCIENIKNGSNAYSSYVINVALQFLSLSKVAKSKLKKKKREKSIYDLL